MAEQPHDAAAQCTAGALRLAGGTPATWVPGRAKLAWAWSSARGETILHGQIVVAARGPSTLCGTSPDALERVAQAGLVYLQKHLGRVHVVKLLGLKWQPVSGL